jgi:hypothetical protein
VVVENSTPHELFLFSFTASWRKKKKLLKNFNPQNYGNPED